MELEGFVCCFCNQRFPLLNEIREHLQNFHHFERNRGRRCGINDCPAVFQNPQSLRSHRSRIHRHARDDNNVIPNIEENLNFNIPLPLDEEVEDDNGSSSTIFEEDNLSEEGENGDEIIEDIDSELSSTDESGEDEDEDEGDEEAVNDDPGINDERKRAVGRFLLRGSTNISEPHITKILHMMQDVVSIYVGDSLRKVKQSLEARGINLRDYVDIQAEVQSTNCVFDLSSKNQRAKYLKREFNVLMPTRYTPGRRFIKYGSTITGQDRPTKRKKDEMMFIPLSKILRNFAENDSFHLPLKYHGLEPGIFFSVEDGCKYQTDNWWKDNDDSMHVRLYTDEVDMCDGQGSMSSGEQKLLMIYCSLTDVDPIFQSSLFFYFLVGIARSEDLNRYGLNKILKPFVDDMKKLEQALLVHVIRISKEGYLLVKAII